MKARLLGFLLAAALCSGQWLDYPTPGLPRTKDGKADLAAKTPRTRDGKPDLSGIWHVLAESEQEKIRLGARPDVFQVPGMESFTTSRYGRDILQDYKPGEITLTPAGQVAWDERRRVGPRDENRCLPFGAPRNILLSEVHKIIQTPGLTLILIELDNMTRQIYTDGRKLPVDPVPSWQGYSIGRWEKDTFVVETIGLNGKTMLDGQYHPTSTSMKITERYTRRDLGRMDLEMTFDDPVTYNRPFTIKVTHLLQPDTDILEYVCAENERDQVHMPATR